LEKKQNCDSQFIQNHAQTDRQIDK